MAWNPDSKVAAARDFGRRFGADRVIILFTTPDGQMGYASYGKTRELCDKTRRLANKCYFALAAAITKESNG
jgi:hypothetical protein